MRKTLLCHTLTLTMVLSFVGSSFGQDASLSKEQLVDKLYEVHGVGRMPFEAYCQWTVTRGNFQKLAEQFPQISSDDWGALLKRLYQAEQPAMKKQFATFMLARFDAAELAQINSFYGSNAGKKLLASIPELYAATAKAEPNEEIRRFIHEWLTEMTKKYNLKY
jgi:hypothetical protein